MIQAILTSKPFEIESRANSTPASMPIATLDLSNLVEASGIVLMPRERVA